MRQVDLDDLAVAAGTTIDTVEQLIEHGVVAPGEDGTFTGSDVRRVRLVLALRTSGVPFEAIGDAIRKGRLSLGFVDDLAPDPIPLVPETNEQLVDRLGLDPEVARQLGRILGTCALPVDEQVRADQVEIFELYHAARETGAPDEGLLRVVRATVESMRHVIDAQRDFADEVLIRPLVESGMNPSEILAVSSARRRQFREMGHRLIDLLFISLADILVGRTSAAGLPAARAGINTGPMVRRDGDYFGSVVNIAARAADYARPREVLVTDSVVEAWSGGDGIIFNGIGAVALKNVRKRIELYRAAPDDTL